MPRLDRRRFLQHSLAAATLAGLPRGRIPANDRIAIGLIGAGSLGRHHHLGAIQRMPELELVAIADVDQAHLDDAVKRAGGSVKGHGDYRYLLDRPDVDAVLIATPDHWHALTAIHACEAGKDVYCEKPLSLTVAEGRAMVQAARRHDRVFQVGTQQRSDRRFRRACELVRGGHLGRVKHVEVVLGRGPTATRVADSPPPPHLDWNFWLGPAPWVPYNEKRCHYDFRWFFDYSGGKMTDWGAHHLDIAQWGLGTELSGPVEVEAKGRFPADSFFETPVDFDVRYRYASGVTMHVTGEGRNGVTFFGERGEIFVSRGELEATPGELLDVPEGSGPVRLYVSHDHHQDFVDCVRARRRPVSDVETGHRSATVAHLGNIAMRMGRKLRWDPAAERFAGDEAANRYLAKPMRAPWSL